MSQQGSFSDHKAAYAAWRERMKSGVESNKLIDLTRVSEPEPDPADEWSAASLFAPAEDDGGDLVDEAHA